jgi:SAM-dependent methyltransferase
MSTEAERAKARELAASHIAKGDPTGWFDALYRQADGDARLVPWADLKPNVHLTEWIGGLAAPPRRALVVGCGLGDDAEFLASLGWSVTAFDISGKAIEWAKKRFPGSKVEYQVADVLHAPQAWRRSFDLVVEIYTLQALPSDLRRQAIPLIAELVSAGGLLFVTARGRDESDPPGLMPWPLTEREIRAVETSGLKCQSFEDYLDRQQPPVRRFRAVFTRPSESNARGRP